MEQKFLIQAAVSRL